MRSIAFQKSENVFSRLAYGAKSSAQAGTAEAAKADENDRPGCTSGRLVTPRSVMDIPQTKSSMAKIAYSRQLLWQQHKKLLTEKLSVRRKQQRQLSALGNRRKSLPVLANTTNMPENLESNLESIHEEDKNPSESSLKTQVGHYSKSEPQGLPHQHLGSWNMCEDDEWRALTEEEESLAHEEASLKKEIEDEESVSIDDEVHRRVILDFSDLDADAGGQLWKNVVDGWDVHHEDSLERELGAQQSESKFRQPGETARLHQRLLSPLRKRCVWID